MTDDGERWQRIWSWVRPRAIPAVFVVVGVLLMAWIAYRSLRPTPPTAAEYMIVVLASSVFSASGGAGFARIGRVQPTHARSAVRRLLQVGRDMGVAQQLLKAETSADPDGRVERGVGPSEIVSAMLVSMSGHMKHAIQDWEDVHKDALEEVLQQDHDIDERAAEV